MCRDGMCESRAWTDFRRRLAQQPNQVTFRASGSRLTKLFFLALGVVRSGLPKRQSAEPIDRLSQS